MKFLLLDFDGTLIADNGGVAYDLQAVTLLPGVVEGLQRLRDAGMRFFIMSNQSKVGRGTCNERNVRACFDHVVRLLKKEGIAIEAVEHCPHRPEDLCACRKPKTGMWDTLHAKVPELEAVECLVVGDRDRDIAFGKSIGCETAHILSREYPLTREATYAVRTLGELADILLPAKGKIVSLDEAIRLAGEARQRQQTIVTTNGAFDLFHEGHRFLLRTARSSGDILIVGVNSDSSIRRSKGPGRPVQSQDQRAHVIARQADVVFVFDDDDPRAWLRHIRPHVHLNAVTYGERCVERPVLDEIGATLILVPVKKELGSTTEIMSHFPPVV